MNAKTSARATVPSQPLDKAVTDNADRIAALAKAAPAKATDTVASVDWSILPAAEVATYQRAVPKVDLETSTPALIKTRVKEAFAATQERGEPVWLVQNCGTETVAAQFVKLAAKYARFSEMTFRGGVDPKQKNQVRYSVRVAETRTRKPKAI